MPRAAVGFYSEADKRKLVTWLQQMSSSDLPRDCQIFSPVIRLSYRQAAKECSGAGMFVPSAGQLPKIASQLAGSNEGCVWTSSFSNDGKAPRKAWDLAKKAIVSVEAGATCSAVCLR
jgi:hypothetical protein